MIFKENLKIDPDWKENILAFSMGDGKMGSLKLCPNGIYIEKTEYIQNFVSEHEFTDTDGVNAVASLFLDKGGNLYELDIWKVDFSELLSFPEMIDS